MTKRFLWVWLSMGLSAPSAVAQQIDDESRCLNENSGFEQTISACTRAIESRQLPPDRLGMVLLSRALNYFEVGKIDQAFADSEAAVRLKPHDVMTLDVHCMWSLRAGRAAHAIPACTKAVAVPRNKGDPIFGSAGTAYMVRGFAYLCLGESASAIADFNRWVQEAAGNALVQVVGLGPAPFFFRAVAYKRLGKDRQAELDFAMARDMNEGRNIQIDDKFRKGYPYPCVLAVLREMELLH